MIRSKGEAGTGNVVEAVRHLRSILGDIRKITQADSAELYDWAKRLQAPVGARAGAGRDRPAAGAAVLRRRHRHPGRRRAGHAARRRGRVRRLGHLQERRPGRAGPRPSSRPPPTSPTRTSSPRSAGASARPCPASRSTASRPSSPSGAGSARSSRRSPQVPGREGRRPRPAGRRRAAPRARSLTLGADAGRRSARPSELDRASTRSSSPAASPPRCRCCSSRRGLFEPARRAARRRACPPSAPAPG